MNTETKVTTGATATTHDKIELPPLPKASKMYDIPGYDEEELKDYARAAIEADRKKFGRNDNDNRKRRGEPVAKVRDRGFEVVDGKHVPTVLVEFPVDDWESRDRFAAAVDAPQPLSESDIPAEPDSAKCAECGAEMIQVRPGKWQHPDCSQSSWAAEPVKVDAEASVPSDTDIDELSREWGLASAAYPSKMMVRDFALALLARYK